MKIFCFLFQFFSCLDRILVTQQDHRKRYKIATFPLVLKTHDLKMLFFFIVFHQKNCLLTFTTSSASFYNKLISQTLDIIRKAHVTYKSIEENNAWGKRMQSLDVRIASALRAEKEELFRHAMAEKNTVCNMGFRSC